MAPRIPNSREGILLSILIEGEKFGREIRDAYGIRVGREMPLGSLYTTLHRLENKGFVRSRLGGSTPGRKGARRRYFKITGVGKESLRILEARVSVNDTGLAFG